ncbi:MAG: hypothetical protein U0793_00355 [Gemmataceae bacterium]
MAKKRKPARRHRIHSRLVEEPSVQREVDYIITQAQQHEVRCVGWGRLVFFSAQSGDAWVLDPDDGLALMLARDGTPQPARIVETEKSFAIDWDRDYSIEGGRFVTVERRSGEALSIVGYPIPLILDMVQRAP